jgi:transcriptional regulator with XRE-family HTH domain
LTLKEIRKRKQLAEKETISEKLRTAYETSGLTVSEISKITGVNKSTLTAWFCGNRTPKKGTADAVITKINGYFEGSDKKEYIDKGECRNLFIDRVYQAFTTIPYERCGKAIIDIYDELPTVTRYATSQKK